MEISLYVKGVQSQQKILLFVTPLKLNLIFSSLPISYFEFKESKMKLEYIVKSKYKT